MHIVAVVVANLSLASTRASSLEDTLVSILENLMVLFLFICVFANDGLVDNQSYVDKIDLTGIKCVVSGKPVSGKYFAHYKQARVFFDCNSSRLAFESGRKKFATKANHQLAVTGQYVQSVCPVKLLEISANSSTTQIAGLKIRACCGGCLARLASKSPERQIEFLFSDSQFEKTFVFNAQMLGSKRLK